MYAATNYKTKKALKAAIAEFNENGKVEEFLVYQEGPFGSGEHIIDPSRSVTLEGPHFPQPHKWYATVTRSPDGKTLKVR